MSLSLTQREFTKVIFLGIDPDDFILASRAARWLLERVSETKDGILSFGETEQRTFYVRKNKASITVRRMV